MATTQQKPQLPALKTPLSASYPSELRSPLPGTPTYIKQEDSQLKTPITPPAAYLDFLSKLSPMLSPQSACSTGTSRRFTFPDSKPALTSIASSDSVATTTSIDSSISATSSNSLTSTAPAVSSRPISPTSNPSSRSSSCSSCSGHGATKDATTQDDVSKLVSTKDVVTKGTKRPERPEPINTSVPPSPFSRPGSARTPRRLHIPNSPYTPGAVRSPLSAATVYSPYSATTMSPRDSWDSSESKRVSVRQVVTRTVTHYSRTPIVDPVPANKKRRTDSGSSAGELGKTD